MVELTLTETMITMLSKMKMENGEKYANNDEDNNKNKCKNKDEFNYNVIS